MTNFSVSVHGDPSSTAWIRFPESGDPATPEAPPSDQQTPPADPAATLTLDPTDPDRASAAVNLLCWVHDVDVMTCRWGRGPGAPVHAQYRMFWRKAA